MKKVFSIAILLAAISACTPEIDKLNDIANGDNAAKPVFFASAESPSIPDTKVYADAQMKLSWNDGDLISVFNMTTACDRYIYSESGGSFTLDDDGGTGTAVDHIYAVYPYRTGTTLSSGGVLTVTLPAEQDWKEHSFGIGANTMVAVSDNNMLGFKNVGGYLMLRLYGDDVSVSRVTLRSRNGEKIAGKAALSIALGGAPTVTMDAEATDAVSIVCDPAVRIGETANECTDFWMVLPPVVLSNGFTVTVTDDQGGTFTKSASINDFTVTRNQLDWMQSLKVVPNYDDLTIQFDDADFKAYCVANFDLNSDHEISRGEAAVVTSINVCTDNISSLGGIEFFASLESLTCAGSAVGTKGPAMTFYGQLESLDVSQNTHLQELDCHGNQLEDLDVSNNPELTSLDCTGNPQLETVVLAPDQFIPTLETPIITNIVYEWDDGQMPPADEIWYTTVDGNPVTLTGIAAFGDVSLVSNTYEGGKGVMKFSGPLKTIGLGSFECSNLSSVILPEGLTKIEGYAFNHCCDMVSLTLPSTLTSIGGFAFSTCMKLTYFTIPDSVTEIGDGAFLKLTSVKAFQGPYASSDHKYLIKDGTLITIAAAGVTSYSIPDGVTRIGNYAFACYPDIQSITIPSSVISIGEAAFEQNSFTSITLPENLRSLDSRAFYLCDGLTSVTIPQSVTSIGDAAFSYCKNLREFNGKFASDDHRCLIINGRIVSFAYAGLTEYVTPADVTRIPFGIFSGNTSLTSITIPDNIDTIDWASFSDCTALTSFTIPKSVTLIYEEAFKGCSSLTSITVLATTPPTLQAWYTPNFVFDDTNNCPIYVPAASVGAYQAADGWSQYADRIQAIL